MPVKEVSCFVSVIVDAPTPGIVEQELGIAPDRSANVGDQVKTERSDIVGATRSTSFWGLYSSKHVSSSDPYAHVEWLIRTFSDADLSGIDCIKSVCVGFTIGADEEWCEFEIPESVVQVAANLKASISLHVYCESTLEDDE